MKYLFFVGLPIAWLLGTLLAKALQDDQRKIAGGAVVILIGAALAIYGLASGSRVYGQPGYLEQAAIFVWIGGFLMIVGLVTLATRASLTAAVAAPKAAAGAAGASTAAAPGDTVKKCPYCAETIQLEAKLCRFCGKSLDIAPSGLSQLFDAPWFQRLRSGGNVVIVNDNIKPTRDVDS